MMFPKDDFNDPQNLEKLTIVWKKIKVLQEKWWIYLFTLFQLQLLLILIFGSCVNLFASKTIEFFDDPKI
jgi:hypothetical protein